MPRSTPLLLALFLAACEAARQPPASPAGESLPAQSSLTPPDSSRPGDLEVEVLLPIARGAPPAPRARLIGSQACASCHPEHAELQRTHHMALTARAVRPGLPGGWPAPEVLASPVRWPEGDVTQAPRVQAAGGRLLLHGRNAEGGPESTEAGVVLGSGLHAMTLLGLEPGRLIRELKLSYFPARGAWEQTPGASEDSSGVGTHSSPERSRWCLSCHSTTLAWRAGALDPSASVLGVQCERCHGPGSEHAAEPTRPGIVSPSRLTRQAQVELCSECHRQPSDLDPVDVFRQKPQLARHAGASFQLSACWRRSPRDTKPTCTECHNPHRNIDPARDRSQDACLRCHAAPEALHPKTKLEAGARCVSCHMPVERDAFGGLQFSSHWIRVPGSAPPAETPARTELAAFLEASYRESLAAGGRGLENRAILWTRLGDLLAGTGRLVDGLNAFREALALSPPYSERVRLASRFERAGRPDEAARILEAAIAAGPGFNAAYYALVGIHASRGRIEEAQRILATWEAAIPGDPLILKARARLKQQR